jgi:hypothetical protein
MDPNTCFHLMFHHLPLHFFQVFLIPDFPWWYLKLQYNKLNKQ